MHTDFPPQVDHDADALNEQRDADDGHQEVGHVSNVEDMHETEVAANINNVGNGTLVALSQFECAPSMNAAVNEDAQGGQAKREEIYKYEQPEFEHPREDAQVGKIKQDECPDGRIVRRSEDGGEDACYEDYLSHLLLNSP